MKNGVELPIIPLPKKEKGKEPTAQEKMAEPAQDEVRAAAESALERYEVAFSELAK